MAALAALVVLGLPIPKLFVEEWSVRVTDQNGAPVSRIRISNEWENYTFNLSDGGELYTDALGNVTFPSQRRIAPLPYWTAKALLNVIGLLIHFSSGTFATVRVSDPDREWSIDPSGRWPSGANCANTKCTASKLHSELRIILGSK
jgi:hypothetical protein